MVTLHPPASWGRPHIPQPTRRAPTRPRPRTAAPPRPARVHPVPPGRTLGAELALPLGAVAAALLVTLLLLSGGSAHPAVALGVFALLTLLAAVPARPVLRPAVALVSWLFYDGFVLNGHSDLAFRSPDRTGLLVLLLAALAGAGCAAALRAVRRHA
ncbi:hypothetical protein HEK616_49330 [Streptomyces nigrescens]|uniref:DUF4118 domain-containing protein n=2 Tax=Streptomyces TaxID=1883 RepID=A0ABM7ZYU8_STRNI|nr:DUF4118 domain-containing protein [Streptomyces nigrescens]MEE4422827.1 DUF4118 domain-containing protein [Streptomyces sp. DSM 41528]BDM71446.1 hypothetical protein HEK616_49330 [Streptomyces nigrescens]